MTHQVDPRAVASPEQERDLVVAASYVGGYRRADSHRLACLFAAMYFGGFRPAEPVGPVGTDLNLPEQGWRSALLHRTRPSVGKQLTDSGETHDDRGLKNRPTEDVTRVPVPPHLVTVLREHLVTFGAADDGRLFYVHRPHKHEDPGLSVSAGDGVFGHRKKGAPGQDSNLRTRLRSTIRVRHAKRL
ncbi:hypothetical protein ACFV0T_09295 [Streptomyces sp. NPDC059582]|uniref:hypothetical protein n=1 Tax=Streptomyces sp. NPDC059582 TaxID=3346875 RepID=UPI00368D12C0